jgi:hypothetical protein
MRLEYFDVGVKFGIRITSICWHPKFPYTYAVGDKHGNIVVGSVNRKLENVGDADWIPIQKADIKGVNKFIFIF